MTMCKKISVCVPSYNRAGMLLQLINSFFNQIYANKELVISDDSNTSAVQDLLESLPDDYRSQIAYYKNEENLGYSKNLLKSLQRATGDFIVVLGDDDVFVQEKALDKYVEVFNQHPEVNYVYSNQIQFSNDLKTEYVFDSIKEDRIYSKGSESIRNMWLTSIFIPGMGFRNNMDFESIYPENDLLFPQLELVGHVLSSSHSYYLSDILIGGRAHETQLGFLAIKGSLIKGTERHGTVELFDIYKDLALEHSLEDDTSFISDHLVHAYRTMLLKEKMLTSNTHIKKNYRGFISASPIARNSLILRFSYVLALVLPKSLISLLIRLYKLSYRIIHRKKILLWDKHLKKMVSKTNFSLRKSYMEPNALPKYGSLSLIKSYIPTKGVSVLDIGCSEGYLGKHFPDNSFYGIDYNENSLKLACPPYKAVYCIDLNNLNLIKDSFVSGRTYDYIVFGDVLEHVLYPESVLQYFAGLLSPGGKIIVSLPNVALWRIRLNLLFGHFDYTEYGVLDNTHLHLYTFKTARSLVISCGFHIRSIEGAANLLGPLVHFLPFLKTLFSSQIIILGEPQ